MPKLKYSADRTYRHHPYQNDYSRSARKRSRNSDSPEKIVQDKKIKLHSDTPSSKDKDHTARDIARVHSSGQSSSRFHASSQVTYYADDSRSSRKHLRHPASPEEIIQSTKMKVTSHSHIKHQPIDTMQAEKILKEIISSSHSLEILEKKIYQYKTLINRLFDDEIQGYDRLPGSAISSSLWIHLLQYIEYKAFFQCTRFKKLIDYKKMRQEYQIIYQLIISFLNSRCFQQLQWEKRVEAIFYIRRIFCLFFTTQECEEKINSFYIYIINKIIINQEIYDQFLDLTIQNSGKCAINLELLHRLLYRISDDANDQSCIPFVLSANQKTAKITIHLIKKIIEGLIKLQADPLAIDMFSYQSILFSIKRLICTPKITLIIQNDSSSLKNVLITFYHNWSKSLNVKHSLFYSQTKRLTGILEEHISRSLIILTGKDVAYNQDHKMLRDIYQTYIIYAVDYQKKHVNNRIICSVISALSTYQNFWDIQFFEKYFQYQDYKQQWFHAEKDLLERIPYAYPLNLHLNILEGLNFFYRTSKKNLKNIVFSKEQIIYVLQNFESYINKKHDITFLLVIELDIFLRQHIQPLNIKAYNAYIIRIYQKMYPWLKEAMRTEHVPCHLQLQLYHIELSGYDLGYGSISNLELKKYAENVYANNVYPYQGHDTMIIFPKYKKYRYFQCLYQLCQTSLLKFHEILHQQDTLSVEDKEKKIKTLKESIHFLLMCSNKMHELLEAAHSDIPPKQHLIYLNIYQEIYFILYFFQQKNLVDEKNSTRLLALSDKHRDLLNQDTLKRAEHFRTETETLEKKKIISKMPKINGVTQQSEYCEHIEGRLVSPVDLVFRNHEHYPLESADTPCSIYVEIQGRQHYVCASDNSDTYNALITSKTLKKYVFVLTALTLQHTLNPNHSFIYLEIETPAYQKMLKTTINQAYNFETLKNLLCKTAKCVTYVTESYLYPE